MRDRCLLCNSENLVLLQEVHTGEIGPRLFNDWGIREFHSQSWTDLIKNKYVRQKLCKDCDTGSWFPAITGDKNFYASISEIYVDERWDKSIVQSDTNDSFTILDVGSGPKPIFSHRTKLPGAKFAVIDENPTVVNSLSLQNVTIFSNPFQIPDDSFRYSHIVALHFLEHIMNPVKDFLQLKKHLSNDGVLWVSTPNRNRKYMHGNFEPLDIPPHHVSSWSIRALASFAELLQMQITSVWVSTRNEWHFYSPIISKFYKKKEYRKIRNIGFYIRHPEKLHGYQILVKVTNKND
jgi:2-polyprenyl-3-methyl-5-hydroxy-6-metoxy-1,4-benzoquinol methylase